MLRQEVLSGVLRACCSVHVKGIGGAALRQAFWHATVRVHAAGNRPVHHWECGSHHLESQMHVCVKLQLRIVVSAAQRCVAWLDQMLLYDKSDLLVLC